MGRGDMRETSVILVTGSPTKQSTLFLVFADFHSVNTLTIAHFKLSMVPGTAKFLNIGSSELVGASSSTLLQETQASSKVGSLIKTFLT